MLIRDIEFMLAEQRIATLALERPFLMRILVKHIMRQLDEQRPVELRGAKTS